MKVWKAFSQSRVVRIICFTLAGALLAASGVGLWYSLSAPSEVEVPGVSYEHKGQFGYVVYLKPNSLYGEFIPPQNEEIEEVEEAEEAEEIPMVFFRDIMEDMQMAFSYKFDCSEATGSVTNDVVVTITAENPGMWQKEVRRWEESHRGKEFRVAFPLPLESLDKVVDDIEDDIGITTSQREFIVRAAVHTTAETRQGEIIEDDFSHEITAILKDKTLEIEGDLKGKDEECQGEASYEEEGWFDYEVYLKYNKLYESVVLRSEPLPVAEPAEPPPSPPPPLQTVGPGLVYFPRIVDNIKASFSYQFDCDKPVREQSEEVEITAIIENPERWSKSLVLVPKSTETGDFTFSFPIDLDYFTEVSDAIARETGAGGARNFNIKADVHIVAETDWGTIDEVYSQTLEMKLEGNTLTFGEELSQSQPGSMGVVSMPADSKARKLKMPSLAGLVAAMLALGLLAWNQTRLKPVGIDVEAEAARAKKKYKQTIVDIQELPEVKPNETVIPIGSVDDLARIADDLVKPMLHQVEEGRHIYCIVDGAVRYQYVSQPQNSGFEDAP